MATLDVIFTRLLQTNPFFGFIITKFKLVKNDKIPTMGVSIQNNCPVLIYNSKFLEEMETEKGIGVLEHEVLHILHRHIGRAKGTNMFISNLGMDMEINQLIKWFINDKATNPKFEYCWPLDGMETNRQYEYYYNELMKRAHTCSVSTGGGKSKQGSGDGEEGDSESEGGDDKDGKSKGKKKGTTPDVGELVDDHSGWGEMTDTQKEELDDIVRSAIQSSRKAGQNLGEYDYLISEFFKVKENWQQILRKWVSDKVKTNTKFKLGFDRRRKTIPARVKSLGTEVVIGFDSSGSCMNDFQMFANQIKKIYETQKKQSKFWVATCDTAVQIQQFKGKSLNLEDCGGGTDMRVLINAIYTSRKLIQGNRLCILFTDGETPWFDTCPYPGMKLLVVYTEQHAKMSGDGVWFKSIVAKEFNKITTNKE